MSRELSHRNEPPPVVFGVKARVTDNSLELHPDTTFEEWAHVGEQLGRMRRWTGWAIGDWVNHGDRAYGEMYSQALEVTGLDYGTLANYAHCAKKYPREQRREGVGFSVHLALAAHRFDAVRDELLDRARDEGLTRREIQAEARERAPLEGAVDYGPAVYHPSVKVCDSCGQPLPEQESQ